MRLTALVEKLPELYQPVFNHPELSVGVSRISSDRLVCITSIHNEIRKIKGRPLRVLDLGCAQGFFCFSLAQLGATVHGVDYLEANIDLCRVIAAENPSLAVTFEHRQIENCIPKINSGQYDIVIGLSVFHHIVHARGVDFAQGLITDIGGKVPVGIFELALTEEQSVYWASSQPERARDLLKGIAFSHEIARHETHLSPVARPLYFASNHYWFLDGRLGQFDKWSEISNDGAPNVNQSTRKFYFSNDLFIKHVYLDKSERAALNNDEFNKEVTFLRNPPAGFPAPKLHFHGRNEREAWLVRDLIPGESLDRRITRGDMPFDPHGIVRDILRQLVTLEEAGLYHNDLRPWNVLVDQDNCATLIDYGAIAEDRRDCVWPGNVYLAFLTFLREVLGGVLGPVHPLRPAWFNPDDLPEPYRSAAWGLLSEPAPDFRFKKFLDCIDRDDAGIHTPFNPPRNMMPSILSATTAISAVAAEYHADLQKKADRIAELEALSGAVAVPQGDLARKIEINAAQAKQVAELQADLAARETTIAAHEREIERLHGHIARSDADYAGQISALRTSTSWRDTAPLRAVSRAVRWLLRGPRWFVRGVCAWITFKPGSRPRRAAGRFTRRLAGYVLARPKLSALAQRAVRMMPAAFQSRLRSIVLGPAFLLQARTAPEQGPAASEQRETLDMSARAKEIYELLVAAQLKGKAD